jgi:hydrogenase-4 component H
MKYPKLRELKEAIRALIKGPYTSRYPFKPHAAFERFRGRPYFHEKDCIGCTACAQVCPSRAIEFKDSVAGSKGTRTMAVRWDICIFCGQCQANCPTTKGITLSREYAFATTEKRQALQCSIDKDMALCSCCAEPVAPYDQYAWVARKIGPLCFSNASLIYFYLRQMALASQETFFPQEKSEPQRADRMQILCPRCRREAALKS